MDPIHKYSTLSELNMTEYYKVFWTLHDVLAISFIKSLKKTNASVNGISLDLFANILIDNVRELFNGNLDDNVPWSKICMLCERFSSIMADNTELVVLNLWIKMDKICKQLDYCQRLMNVIEQKISA